MIRIFLSAFTFIVTLATTASAQPAPTRDQALKALSKAVEFFHAKVAIHGGYVWRYSSDLKYRQGEGLAYDQRIWVQPPGTPAVGLAFLDAYRVTKNPAHLKAARDAADALVKGQLYSGGWPYSVTFDPKKRLETNYRIAPSKGDPKVKFLPGEPGGWEVWRKRRYKSNMTIVDDDTTPSALRLLMQVDKALAFEDKRIHEAVQYGLASLLKAQFPVGAWSHNYDRFPRKNPDEQYYPVKKASYPESWSRTWTRKFNGCYVINDRISLNVIKTMLDAFKIYGKKEYLQSAVKGGQFLLLARLPDPQPAWAQQYDRHMQPVWDRPFEPPAITGFESQDVLETLLLLFERTGDKKFLDAVPKSLAYLQRSKLPDGKLARFYELRTNKPLFFTTKYKLTYDRGKMPAHYGFVFDSRLEDIAARYEWFSKNGSNAKSPAPNRMELAKRAQKALASMDQRGAWTEPGWVRNEQGRKVVNGIILSETFIANVEALVQFIEQTK